jgi:hypothetical protein
MKKEEEQYDSTGQVLFTKEALSLMQSVYFGLEWHVTHHPKIVF